MKNIIFVALCIAVFAASSCQKEELNTEAIRAQLAAHPSLSVAEVQSELSKLKDGNVMMLVVVFPLSSDYFTVFNDHADKYFIYYEVNGFGQREKMITIIQTFPVIDGNVDLTSYSLSYEIGCPSSKIFILRNQNNISQINYFFRFDDGRQFAFFGERNSGMVELPPINGGKWQLEVTYDDMGMVQKYTTYLIDFYGSAILDLKIQLQKENTICYVEIDNMLTKKAYLIQFATNDDLGNYYYFNYPVVYEESQNSILCFDVPFDAKYVVICGTDGCFQYLTENMSQGMRNGKKVYRL